jgi:hypothetical protein
MRILVGHGAIASFNRCCAKVMSPAGVACVFLMKAVSAISMPSWKPNERLPKLPPSPARQHGRLRRNTDAFFAFERRFGGF